MPDGRHLVPEERLIELAILVLDGRTESVTLDAAELRGLLEHIDMLTEALHAEGIAFCRICGCTQNNACEGACGWAEEDLCTTCAEDLEEPDHG